MNMDPPPRQGLRLQRNIWRDEAWLWMGPWTKWSIDSVVQKRHEKVSLNVKDGLYRFSFQLRYDPITSFHINCFAGVCSIVYGWHVACSADFDAGSLIERWQVILHFWSQPFLEAHFGIVCGSIWLSRVVWLDRDEAENNQTIIITNIVLGFEDLFKLLWYLVFLV